MTESALTKKHSLRPPIVAVLGHVDHGKTTLLDNIRKSNIASREAGGITQGIGASYITLSDGKNITFIDTPGHAAFSNMRSQGAKVADIAILVVGGDDGVKPQTKEALEHILDANIPFIVAATKMDLPSASSEQVRVQLQKEGVLFEGFGGDTPLVEVSAKTGKGVDVLLETISLLAEVTDISGDENNPLEAVIIEVGHDKRGATASVVVRNGCINVGDTIVSQDQEARVRALFDSFGKSVRSIYPGQPCLILGFERPPMLGSKIWHKGHETDLSILNEKRRLVKPPIDESQILSVVVKAKSKGSLDAIIEGLPKEVFPAFSGVGIVSESDIFLAKNNNARILAFELSISPAVTKLAETEGVVIETFDIIYKLFERIEELLKGERVEIVGKAEIIGIFPFDGKKIAGSKIITGIITPGVSVHLLRGDKDLGVVKVISIKKHKSNVNAVKEGEECGILFSPQLDFEIGDVLLSQRK